MSVKKETINFRTLSTKATFDELVAFYSLQVKEHSNMSYAFDSSRMTCFVYAVGQLNERRLMELKTIVKKGL